MRKDWIKLPLALLAAGVLAGGPFALRGQDTLAAGGAPEPAPLVRSGDRVVTGDLRIGPDEVVEGKVVVAGGTLVVEGRVTGNATVTGGGMRLAPGARVGGTVQVTGGDLVNAGSIGGDARVVGGRLIDEQGSIGGEMRVESGDAGTGAGGHGPAAGQSVRIGHRTWLSAFGDGAVGLVQTLAMALLLAGVGAGLVFYARPQLERVSDTVRSDLSRVGLLGLASNFLWLPVYLVGVLVLALTLVGIPFLVVWVPLFPVAVLAAAAFGLVAVAHAIGERTAEQRGSLERLQRNPYAYILTGLALVFAPMMVAHLLELTGFLGLVADLLEAFSILLLWAAASVGLGAVILTRAGTRRHWGWAGGPPYDPVFDADPLADEPLEPAGRMA
jgi:hypothetical protein